MSCAAARTRRATRRAEPSAAALAGREAERRNQPPQARRPVQAGKRRIEQVRRERQIAPRRIIPSVPSAGYCLTGHLVSRRRESPSRAEPADVILSERKDLCSNLASSLRLRACFDWRCSVPGRKFPFAQAAHLKPEDLARLRNIIPGVEPALGRCTAGPRRGRTYPVAETYLVGNERAYLNQCIDFELDFLAGSLRRQIRAGLCA